MFPSRYDVNAIFLRHLIGALLIALLVGVFAANVSAKKKGGGGVIRLEETVIEGRVQKPNAFFINTRQGMVYEIMEIKESFVAEIPKAVADGDF